MAKGEVLLIRTQDQADAPHKGYNSDRVYTYHPDGVVCFVRASEERIKAQVQREIALVFCRSVRVEGALLAHFEFAARAVLGGYTTNPDGTLNLHYSRFRVYRGVKPKAAIMDGKQPIRYAPGDTLAVFFDKAKPKTDEITPEPEPEAEAEAA